MAYFITFACHGARLHSDRKGSVDRSHNVPGTPVVEPNPDWNRYEQRLIKSGGALLDAKRRELVLSVIRQHCSYRGWVLLAAHVRSNHVHVVVWADIKPEMVMLQLKSYASRGLNLSIGRQRRWWARHGSTRYLWKIEQVAAAVDYVAHEQGTPMALYVNSE